MNTTTMAKVTNMNTIIMTMIITIVLLRRLRILRARKGRARQPAQPSQQVLVLAIPPAVNLHLLPCRVHLLRRASTHL